MEWELLAGLDDGERRAVLAATARRRYRKGDVLFHEGDPGDTLHLLEQGRVAVRVSSAAGDTATLEVLGPGEAFGEQALLSPDARRTATVVALESVQTRALHRRDFDALRRHDPVLLEVLVAVLATQVRRLSHLVVEAHFVPADRRVVRRLAALLDRYGAGAPVDVPITQDDLASLAGTTRPTANRALRELAERGVVELTRGHITVRDPEALRAAAR